MSMGIIVYRDTAARPRRVGRIDYEIEEHATFRYDEQYLDAARSSGELGISERLPLDDEPYSSADFGPFFKGLLQEGEMHDALTDLYQIPRNDYLSLLEQLGCESIGALTFVSESVDRDEYVPRYDSIGEDRISVLRQFPQRGVVNEASETRLSLSGAQTKVAWFLPEGADAESAALDDWRLPKGTAPSSHIIKLSRKGEERIATNELACSKLSEACGFRTAKTSFVPEMDGVIAVERYDRIWKGEGDGRHLLRLHQEDFCQALGLQPYQKYQPDGVEADYLCRISNLLESASDNPLLDKREFAKRLLFNYVIGNSDAHLKNSSLLYNVRWTGRMLAPMYDIISIPSTGYSTQMPFDIGGHRALGEIDEKDLMAIPLDLDIPLDTFGELAREVLVALESYDTSSAQATVASMVDEILTGSQARMKVVKRYLGS